MRVFFKKIVLVTDRIKNPVWRLHAQDSLPVNTKNRQLPAGFLYSNYSLLLFQQ